MRRCGKLNVEDIIDRYVSVSVTRTSYLLPNAQFVFSYACV